MIVRSMLLGLAAAGLCASAAVAQDFYSAPASDLYGGPLFDFEGLYVGGAGGGYLGDNAALSLGVLAGVNFAVTDFLYAGLEFQGGAVFADNWTYDAFALLHAGGLVTDQLMAYVAAGVGRVGGEGSFALGAGVEFGLMAPVSLRGEVLGIGELGHGFDAAKTTASVVFHFN